MKTKLCCSFPFLIDTTKPNFSTHHELNFLIEGIEEWGQKIENKKKKGYKERAHVEKGEEIKRGERELQKILLLFRVKLWNERAWKGPVPKEEKDVFIFQRHSENLKWFWARANANFFFFVIHFLNSVLSYPSPSLFRCPWFLNFSKSFLFKKRSSLGTHYFYYENFVSTLHTFVLTF